MVIQYSLMELWLVRHGEAVPERLDPERPLSPEGVRSVTRIAETLAGQMWPLDLVAASGKKRAFQTAAILGKAAGYPEEAIVRTAALSPGAEPEAFLAFLSSLGDRENVLCVGHLPSIAVFASFLLTPGDAVGLLFQPGTACRIRLAAPRRGAGELVQFL